MTREDLRKIFDEAEKAVCTPENYHRVLAEITDSSKLPPSNPEQLPVRVNLQINREIVFEVLARVLADK